jgi:hypothetical protein
MIIETKIIGDDTIALILKNAPKELNKRFRQIFHKYGNEMRNYIIRGMRDTPKAPWRYKRWKNGKKWHYPSLPGGFPAIDSGRLISQLKYFSNDEQLEIGIMSDVPYAKFLETGTSKMEARPFLEPTLKEFLPEVKSSIMDAIRETIKR